MINREEFEQAKIIFERDDLKRQLNEAREETKQARLNHFCGDVHKMSKKVDWETNYRLERDKLIEEKNKSNKLRKELNAWQSLHGAEKRTGENFYEHMIVAQQERNKARANYADSDHKIEKLEADVKRLRARTHEIQEREDKKRGKLESSNAHYKRVHGWYREWADQRGFENKDMRKKLDEAIGVFRLIEKNEHDISKNSIQYWATRILNKIVTSKCNSCGAERGRKETESRWCPCKDCYSKDITEEEWYKLLAESPREH